MEIQQRRGWRRPLTVDDEGRPLPIPQIFMKNGISNPRAEKLVLDDIRLDLNQALNCAYVEISQSDEHDAFHVGGAPGDPNTDMVEHVRYQMYWADGRPLEGAKHVRVDGTSTKFPQSQVNGPSRAPDRRRRRANENMHGDPNAASAGGRNPGAAPRNGPAVISPARNFVPRVRPSAAAAAPHAASTLPSAPPVEAMASMSLSEAPPTPPSNTPVNTSNGSDPLAPQPQARVRHTGPRTYAPSFLQRKPKRNVNTTIQSLRYTPATSPIRPPAPASLGPPRQLGALRVPVLPAQGGPGRMGRHGRRARAPEALSADTSEASTTPSNPPTQASSTIAGLRPRNAANQAPVEESVPEEQDIKTPEVATAGNDNTPVALSPASKPPPRQWAKSMLRRRLQLPGQN